MGEEAGMRWLPRLDGGDGPVYLRIVEALAKARATGLLQPGDRLATQRDIARHLGVDLTTVTRAFTEARRRHLIDAAPGRGTFLTAAGPEEPILDLSMNIPPPPAGLALPALIRGGVEGLLKRSSADALLSYHPGPGSPGERAAASLWLEMDGIRLPVGRVAVGAGAQALLAATLANGSVENDVILADALTYPGFIALARTMRRTVMGVESDDDGMRPDRLEELAREHGARMVYLNPTLHNPTTLTMPEGRRKDLIAVARRTGLLLIEDDPYSPLLAEQPASFLSLAPDATIHIATLAKCISPFLRTAFLTAPNVEDLESIAGHLRSLTLMAPPLMTGLAAEWIRSGLAGEIALGVRREAEARQALAAGILPGGLRSHPSGLHLWMPLASGRSAADIVDTARRRALAVSPAREFAVGPQAPEAIRLALGAIPDRDRLAEALRGLGALLEETPERRPALV